MSSNDFSEQLFSLRRSIISNVETALEVLLGGAKALATQPPNLGISFGKWFPALLIHFQA